jgi:uncharacterized alpha-E superfamily protein
MLGRTADNLYWMGRYVERAENLARILDVSFRMALVPQSDGVVQSIWTSALEVAGGLESYEAKFGAVGRDATIRFLAFDADNASSIHSCIRAARDNARALRGAITTEMWEAINTTWLEMQDVAADASASNAQRNFFEWIKDRAHLFRGVTEGTMLRDDCHGFVRLGWSIERGDNTARLLDSKYHVLLPALDQVGGAVDYYQWGALLRSVGAFSAYHKIYSNVITPWRVAELLVLRADMPRSLHACVDRTTEILDGLSGVSPRECRRQIQTDFMMVA